MNTSEPSPSFRRFEARFLRPYRGAMLLALAGLLAQSLLLLPIPVFQGWVLDVLLSGARRHTPVATASWVIAVSLVATVGAHLARMVLAWKVAAMMGRISQEVVVALRGALHRKLMQLPMAYFDAQQTGRLMARVTSDVGSILSFLNAGSLQLINDLILALGIAVVLLWLHWLLALVALATLPLYVLNQRFFARRINDLSIEIRAQVAAVYALLSERVSAVRIVRSFAKEEAELAALDERIDRHRALSWSNTRTNATLSALATLISGIGTVFVLTAGTLLIGRGRMSIGELLAFYALIGQLYGPIVRLSQFQATIASTRVSVERLFEVLDEPAVVRDPPDALPLDRPEGALEFREVRFAYPGSASKVFDGLDLEIRPGTTVGVFGPSGAGKSTLLSLIPRLYELGPQNGSILLDGRDLCEFRLSELRRAVVLVPQHAQLFEGTIRSNLLYAAPGATDAQIRRALEAADLAAMVDAFPLGLETPVGERGLSLSGGQRQRLALARALVLDPRVLLLDDCTSALDAETECRILKALRALLAGRTCLIVSHKVSSIAEADRILVVDGGRIVESGTPATLVSQGGVYANAYRQQTQALRAVDVSGPRGVAPDLDRDDTATLATAAIAH